MTISRIPPEFRTYAEATHERSVEIAISSESITTSSVTKTSTSTLTSTSTSTSTSSSTVTSSQAGSSSAKKARNVHTYTGTPGGKPIRVVSRDPPTPDQQQRAPPPAAAAAAAAGGTKSEMEMVGKNLNCVCEHLNMLLADEPLAKKYLKLSDENILEKFHDGVLLCAMALRIDKDCLDTNYVFTMKPSSVDKDYLMKRWRRNINLGTYTLQTLGVWPKDLPVEALGNRLSILGVLVSFVTRCRMKDLSLLSNTDLRFLLTDPNNARQISELQELKEEQVLLRWANQELAKNNGCYRIENLHRSLQDCLALAQLLQKVSNVTGLTPMSKYTAEKDVKARAAFLMEDLRKCGLDKITTAEHIIHASLGLGKNTENRTILSINTLLLATIFNKYPNIPTQDFKDVPAKVKELCRQGASEETLRVWLNSFGLNPPVRYLKTDLQDGIALLTVWDKITPGCVNWRQVSFREGNKAKQKFARLANCEQVIQIKNKHALTRKQDCSASNIVEGNMKHTLGLVFNMMLRYSQMKYEAATGEKKTVSDSDLLKWCNDRFTEQGKHLNLLTITDSRLLRPDVLGSLAEWVILKVNPQDSSYERVFNDIYDIPDNRLIAEWRKLLSFLRANAIQITADARSKESREYAAKALLLALHAIYIEKFNKKS